MASLSRGKQAAPKNEIVVPPILGSGTSGHRRGCGMALAIGRGHGAKEPVGRKRARRLVFWVTVVCPFWCRRLVVVDYVLENDARMILFQGT